jgi:acetyl esterase/lipase
MLAAIAVATGLALPVVGAAPAAEKLPLWSGPAPVGEGQFEATGGSITVHRPAAEKANGAAVVICPGGGYTSLVKDGEGYQIARWLKQHGIAGIVLEYRLPQGRPLVPLLDAQRAIRTVRFHAKQWNIDPSRVGIMGFSAGGHLAATAGTLFDGGDAKAADPIERMSCRPDFAILVYPAIDLGPSPGDDCLFGRHPTPELVDLFRCNKQVTEKTPPMFLACARDDGLVVHSRMMYEALKAHGAAAEYLELPRGGHGLDHYQGPMWDAWQNQSLAWLAARGVIPQTDAAVAASPADQARHQIKIFNGQPRVFASIGPSTSWYFSLRLQRKLYRYTGKVGADCPLRIVNFSRPGGQFRMPGWIDCRPSTADPALWEAHRTDLYKSTVLPLIQNNPQTPVSIIAMINTGLACAGMAPGSNAIQGADDAPHIQMAVNFLRTHVKAALDDGAALYLLSPKKYWRDLDEPHQLNRNEERYAVTKVAAERIPGFVYVKGVWEDTARDKEIALVGDGHHPTQLGDEIIASKFFRTMLQHDGLAVPAWDQQEVDAVRKAFLADPTLRGEGLGRNPFDVDDNRDGWLSEAECLAHKVGHTAGGKFHPLRYVTPWKPQDAGLAIPAVPGR